jgi:hypothetical protein
MIAPREIITSTATILLFLTLPRISVRRLKSSYPILRSPEDSTKTQSVSEVLFSLHNVIRLTNFRGQHSQAILWLDSGNSWALIYRSSIFWRGRTFWLQQGRQRFRQHSFIPSVLINRRTHQVSRIFSVDEPCHLFRRTPSRCGRCEQIHQPLVSLRPCQSQLLVFGLSVENIKLHGLNYWSLTNRNRFRHHNRLHCPSPLVGFEPQNCFRWRSRPKLDAPHALCLNNGTSGHRVFSRKRNTDFNPSVGLRWRTYRNRRHVSLAHIVHRY